LSGIGGQAFYISALPFGIQSIKAKLDFPEPESPVITTNLFLGMATSTFLGYVLVRLYDDIFLGSNVERSTCIKQ
jgi:uncharacterized protein involved in exopolysaccharide biosynthesis